MSGFSCHSSFSTHICNTCQSKLVPLALVSGTNLLEGTQTSENAAAGPRGVYALWRREDLDPHVLHRQSLHFVEQPITESLCQRGTTREHNVAIERLAQIHVCPLNSLHDNLVHTRVLKANELGVEENLGCAKAFSANLELISIRSTVAQHSAHLQLLSVRQCVVDGLAL
jgi:hypothetical protein